MVMVAGTAAEWSGANPDHPFATSNASSIHSEDRHRSEPFDVTFVVQTSTDRVWLIADTCTRWTGQIVLILFLSDELPFKTNEVHSLPTACRSGSSNSTTTNANSTSSDDVPNSSLISYHNRTSTNKHNTQVEVPRVKSGTLMGSVADFPINYLRNLGIGLVQTSHFLVADVDFVPSRNLYTEIMQHGSLMLNDLMMALVVPAFQRHVGSCSSVADCRALAAQLNFIPASLEELQQCVAGNTSASTSLMANPSRSLRSRRDVCFAFQAEKNHYGHSTTRSSDWLAASAHWPVPQPITCIDSIRYEPYLVLSTWGSDTPRYDEQFTGYGKNKIQFVNHLRVAGFKFSVLPREFLVHFPHPFSPAKLTWLQNTTLRKHVDTQFASFMKKLAREYSGLNSSVTPLCS